mgnify:FL=1|tara:strand:- start:445 stop:729 length:285 start_codon:yes stop_codon:yes gene_type:complete
MGLRNVTAIHEQAEEQKNKEQHMADYIASIRALEEAMEPFKEQKRELKGNYIENGWLTKEDISLTVKAYRLLKTEVDLDQLIDIYESLRKKEGK